MTKRILVCGGRDFMDYPFLAKSLGKLIHDREWDDIFIISGAARGADIMAINWAMRNDHQYREYPAEWHIYGNRAGLIRNANMLAHGKPDIVVAFKGGRGTAHMKRIAKEAGVEVVDFGESECGIEKRL